MAGGSVNCSERTVSNIPICSSASSDIPSLSTAHHFVSIKLTHKNYLFWRTQVVPFLDGHGLMSFVDGTNPSPSPFLPAVEGGLPTANTDRATWFRHDRALMSMLISSLSEEAMHLTVGCRTSREVWESIEQSLASASCARSLNLLGQLQSLSQGDSTVAGYLGRACVILEDLALAGRTVGLDEKNLYLFRELRPEFQNLIASLSVRGQPVTLSELADFLGAQEFIQGIVPGGPPVAFAMQRDGGGGQNRRGGHGNSRGQNFGGQRGGSGGRSNSGRGTGHRGHGGSGGNNGLTWIPDTGATNHVTPNIATLSTSEEYTGYNTKETLLKGNSHGGPYRLPIATSSPSVFLTACKSSRFSLARVESSSSSVLDLVYTDIWGPAPLLSIDGYRYFVIFVDDYTRFTWHVRFDETVYPFATKNTVQTSQPAQHHPWAESVLHPAAAVSMSLGTAVVRPSSIDDDPVPPPPPHAATANHSASPEREPRDQADQPVKRPRSRPHGKMVKYTVWTHEMHTQSRSQAPPSALTIQVCPPDPTCYTQAVKYSEWRKAMDQEFNALLQNQTWQLVSSQPGMNIIGCKWVLRTKRKADGSIERHKARLVAKEFNEVPGQDFFDMFSPVVKPTTVRLLLYLALSSGWYIKQLDTSKTGVSLFYYSQGSDCVYLLVYVDDILVMGSNTNLVTHLVSKLSTAFKIRDLGELGFFLRIEAVKCSDGILFSQQRYMHDILKRAGMAECKPLSTPIPTSKLVTSSTVLHDDPTQYKSLAGALQYLTITRPDLSFAVNQLCQHMHAPTIAHWEQLKRVLRYVKGTVNFGLRVRQSSSREIHAFSDSDCDGCPEDRKSTSAFVVFLGSNLMSWVIWIMSLLREIHVPGISVPKLWCDNLGPTYMCVNPIFHARTKYVEIDYHFVRDRVAAGEIQVNFISTKDQLAYIFTKALPGPRFSFFKDKLQVTSIPCA
ncbi:PREDICTED: uncharacterized protein LOC109177743 [Ipomoea nil]|uniref:uncharacterized protein LOC109177743 n=1 Tax=Ipomoea nil TaxID=35883 RepID=UPI0009011DAE|nr:PREDICTED: uncharacterized protein LOC109177743 [Ipomoea nil]